MSEDNEAMGATGDGEPSDEAIEAYMEAVGVEAEPDEDDDRASQIEEATAEVCQFQERSERAWHAADLAKESAKLAVDEAKGADSDLRDAARRLRKLREGRFPDPEKFPLFDPKAAINAEFSPDEDAAELGLDQSE